MPFPPDELYWKVTREILISALSRADPAWSSLVPSEATESTFPQPLQTPEGRRSAQRELLELAATSRPSPAQLAAALKIAMGVGLAGLPLSWTNLKNGLYRSAVSKVLTSHGYRDEADWPNAGTCRPYYSLVPDPPTEMVLNEVPVSTGRLLVGNYLSLGEVKDVDVVVSLCRTGADDVPPGVDHFELWLTDHIAFSTSALGRSVLMNASETAAEFLEAGASVLIHCVVGRSRSPRVAAMTIARVDGLAADVAVKRVQGLIPGARLLAVD